MFNPNTESQKTGTSDFLYSFASDNFSGVHPKIMTHLAACNHGHAMAYGEDIITARARQAFSALFEQPVQTHFAFNGTAANVLSLMAFSQSHGAILCSDVAHICNDESTAPERTLGMRLLPLPSHQGKISADTLRKALARGAHGVHGVHPVALTLTQPTELGTVYTVAELAELTAIAHAHKLGVHVDGARLGNAVATLGVSVHEMLVKTGIDVVSFGGTKQGMMFGEAVVFLNTGLGQHFPYWQKHTMQLASKMRFIAAQFEALLADNLWLENARHGNRMAQQLYAAVQKIPSVNVLFPVQANSVFAQIPPAMIAPLQRESFFWPWQAQEGLVRWMCGFDTQAEQVQDFVRQIALINAKPPIG